MSERAPRCRGSAIPIPSSFFEDDLPVMRDVAEIKVLLTLHRLSAEPEWEDGVVAERAILADHDLLRGLRSKGSSRPPLDEIHRGIELAVARAALLRFHVDRPAETQTWLMIATDENRSRIARFQRGDLPLPDVIVTDGTSATIRPEQPNIFRLYEQNVGLVTPLVAEQLIEALEMYPESWIEEAIGEAVSYNRRQWRYIQRVLQRWATEGRGYETTGRSGSTEGSVNPEKYLRGKYASLFRRK